MPLLSSARFMRALPAAVRPHLPASLRQFKTAGRSWLCQFYYRDPAVHYEVWNLGERRGRLEIGLHFESKNPTRNTALLASFSQHMFEVKAALGAQWEAEQWDRGWTKVYETVPHAPFSDDYLQSIAVRLARAITVLHPIWEAVAQE